MAETRPARIRKRTITMRPVSIDVDETATHYLVFVSPHPEAQALGIGYHRSRLPKCACVFPGRPLASSRCRYCVGWTAEGMAHYVGKLLRSYPKVRVTVPAEQVQTRRDARFVRGSVAA